MKKISLLLIIMLLITGCSKEVKEEKIIKEEKKEIIEEKYVDDNPIKVGLYDGNNLVHEINSNIANHTDIAVLTTYFTEEEKLDSYSVKYNYKKYYNMYQNIENYKIGYYVSYSMGEEKHETMILNPSTTLSLQPIVMTYIYDDINQVDGAHYSHLEDKDFNEQSILSTIKVCLGWAEPIDYIDVMAFTYDDMDDFDKDGHYRGNSKYTVRINFNS